MVCKVVQQPLQISNREANLLHTWAALGEETANGVSSPVGSNNSILGVGADPDGVAVEKIVSDALIDHRFIFIALNESDHDQNELLSSRECVAIPIWSKWMGPNFMSSPQNPLGAMYAEFILEYTHDFAKGGRHRTASITAGKICPPTRCYSNCFECIRHVRYVSGGAHPRRCV